MRNPNESKYFDEARGCTLNSKCAVCQVDIYVPEGIHTMYDGKLCVHNQHPYKVMSIWSSKVGCVCEGCWEIIKDDE